MTATGDQMTARAALFAGIAPLALVLAACGEYTTASGPDIGDTAPRIVSLNPCTDAILVDVASAHQVLALSHYSHDPASSSLDIERARQFPKTSGTVEEIAALDPDIVLASSFLSPPTRAALDDLGFGTETFGIANELEAAYSQIHRVAELSGRENMAAGLVSEIDRALERNAAPSSARAISTVLWQPGEIVPGETTLISQLMRHAGFSSHSETLGLGQADHLSLEMLLANPPDLLLVAGNSRGQMHPALAQLEDTRIETLDPSLLYCGGPTIVRALDRLGEIRRSMT